MLRHAFLAATLIASTAPALAREPRTVRVCDEAGHCRRMAPAQVRRALLAVTGQGNLPTEAAANAATNRRQLNALLAHLR